MVWNKKVCKICESNDVSYDLLTNTADLYKVKCLNCGDYQISATFLESRLSILKTDLLLFSGYLQLNSTVDNPIVLKSDFIDKIPDIILPFKRMTVTDKVNNIFKFIYSTTTKVINKVEISEKNIYRFFLQTPEELRTVLQYLFKRRLIDLFENTGEYICVLTIEGWERYEKLIYEVTNIDSKQIFVAMSFDPNFRAVYDNAINPAVESCGFKAIRVDCLEHTNKICDQIIAEINKSRFLIADFTQNKHGVYFEAGYALGLGIPVIWSCKKDDLSNVHFDTRQYNHIDWKDLEDFKARLISRLRALTR